jgi:glycerol-1-phosphate dehydrogenase [NAD(P)+]
MLTEEVLMDTKISLVQNGALQKVGQVFVEAFGHTPALLIADGNTQRVAGFAVARSLEQSGIEVRQFVFPATPQLYADEHSIAQARLSLELDNSIAVVLGSGTLNDITKRASAELDRPYMVVATAPSVDGYTSYGAAVSIGGFKQTLPCAAPLVVLADTQILCEAPLEMIASGFGDCMAKFTAGMDWILADLLGVQAIRDDVWTMVQKPLRQVYQQHTNIAKRESRAVGQLFDALSASGFAMQIMHDSRPASGAEHLISHIWEMEHLSKDRLPVSHGFKVAVGTLAVVFLYENLLGLDISDCYGNPTESWEEREASLMAFFHDEKVARQSLAIAKSKFFDKEALLSRRKELISLLPQLKERITDQLPPYQELKHAMSQVGCPTHPREINASLEDLKRAMVGAQMIRNRYTVLDLYYELGLFDQALLCIEGM